MDNLPKSYLADFEREGLTQNGIYLAESISAGNPGDEESQYISIRIPWRKTK